MPRRTKPAQRLVPMPRDDRILADIFEHGALTAEQIAALNFPPNGKFENRVFPVTDVSSAVYTRLRKLSGYHYLEQRNRPHTDLGMKGQLHRLSKEGIAVLAAQLGCTVEDLLSSRRQTVPKRDLEHFILINDVWIALKIAASQHHAKIVTWISESEFKKDPLIVPADATLTAGKSRPQEFVPDGYFHLEIERNQRRTLHRFVEIDRGKETGISTNPIYRTWETKVNLYQQYYDLGAYQKRFRTQQMAILTITTSEERLANLKRVSENSGGESLFWFTTFDKATSDAILTKPIWQLAGKTGLAPMVWENSEEPPLF
jgi:Replication-relaxation